jgi:hypothetical protein
MKIIQIKVFLIAFLAMGCADKLAEVSSDKFVGLWEVKGRGTFEGMQIRIEKTDDKLVGTIARLNDNKIVQMFAQTGDTWVSEIKRLSNFEFRLTEKKIARDLFSLYGLPTSQEFKVQFIDDNTIGLAADNSDPELSTIQYKRVE